MRINFLQEKKFIVMFFLGFASGIPIVLVMSTLKTLLAEKGFDLKTIGFFSLATLPYSLKFFYAPLIDSLSIFYLTKKIGQRRSWILLSQLFLIIFIAALGNATNTANIELIAALAFLVAFFSASQDIAIDAYRIELFSKENQGFAVSFYTYGYRIGMLVSGAFALFLADIIDWSKVYYVMSIIMLSGLVSVLFADETRIGWQKKEYNFLQWFKNYAIEPLLDFSHRKSWFVIFIFIICFKLSDVFAGSLTMPFLLSLEFSKTEIAAIVKTFGFAATLIGIFCGGILIKKIDIYKVLFIALLAQGLSNLSFSYLTQIGHNREILAAVIFIENFSGGIGDAVFVAYLSALCNINFSATQFAALTSFASLARSLFAANVGIFAEFFGWYKFFIFSSFLIIPALIALLILYKKTPLKTV